MFDTEEIVNSVNAMAWIDRRNRSMSLNSGIGSTDKIMDLGYSRDITVLLQ